jgi:hypothetical protein
VDTNNRAEYLAHNSALTRVDFRLGGLARSGCRVKGALVINQMTDDRGINYPALGQLNRQAAALAKRISDGVRYRSHPATARTRWPIP